MIFSRPGMGVLGLFCLGIFSAFLVPSVNADPQPLLMAKVQVFAEAKPLGRVPASESKVCAHRMHAFGTQLSLLAPGNRKSACVVRARGPWVSGEHRDLDVSRQVAHELGLEGAGPFEVHYQVVGRETH